MTNPPSPDPAYNAPAAPAAPGYGQPAPAVPGRTLSIVGLVLAFIAAPIGLIISIVALVKLNKAGAPKGLAIAGIIIGALITIGWIFGIIGFVALLGGVVSMCNELGPGVWDVNGVTYTCG